MGPVKEVPVDALAVLLDREQNLMELLVFRLVELRQLLLAGETRFLQLAAAEVEAATSAVREAELERAVLVQGIASDRGLHEPTLTELLADVPDRWRPSLERSHQALRTRALEAADLLQTTRRLADAGSRSLAATLQRLDPRAPETPLTYGPRTAARTPRPRVQQSL